MIGKQIKNYKLLSLLGTGGMSEVYLAQNTKTGKKVAIKILNESLSSDPQYIKRFKREVEISRTLSHPNIVKIISCGTDKDIYYIIYEYIEGLTLDKYIKSKKLFIKEIEDITLQILNGLSYAHSKNIIHRDIKPSNIMISNGNVKILDFGIARATTKSTITKTGMFMGSPHYTSPEQIDGKKVDQRTDIYSLGIVLYEMVEGKVPFQADTPLGFMRAHLDKPVPKITKRVPQYFEEIIYKCLAKKPGDRFGSLKEILTFIKLNSNIVALKKFTGIDKNNLDIPKKAKRELEKTSQLSRFERYWTYSTIIVFSLEIVITIVVFIGSLLIMNNYVLSEAIYSISFFSLLLGIFLGIYGYTLGIFEYLTIRKKIENGHKTYSKKILKNWYTSTLILPCMIIVFFIILLLLQLSDFIPNYILVNISIAITLVNISIVILFLIIYYYCISSLALAINVYRFFQNNQRIPGISEHKIRNNNHFS